MSDNLGNVGATAGFDGIIGATIGIAGGGGTSNYNDLINKPSINGVTLTGNKTLNDLGAASLADVAQSVDDALQEAKDSGEFDGPPGPQGESGATGPQGPAGVGVPAGGSTGQVLAKRSGTDYDTEWVNQSGGDGAVNDVQVNSTSVVTDGVANVPLADTTNPGVVKIPTGSSASIFIDGNGAIHVSPASTGNIKSGTSSMPISAGSTDAAAFYGLARAAGDTTQKQSSNPVGTYTSGAKQAIKTMLGITDVTSYNALNNKPSINGVTLSGNSTLPNLGIASAEDVAAKYTKPSGGIPASDLASAVQISLDKADTALQTAPVTSVNGQTGAVVLDASDVGAGTYSKPSGGIPASDLASSVQTSLGKADTALQTVPVASVAGKTGVVTLDAGDVEYDGTDTYAAGSVGAGLAELKSEIGDLSDLDTTAKTNLVAAINEAAQSGGGGGGTVDNELSTTSTNPVQNKIITANLSPCIGVVTKNNLGSSIQNLLDLPYDSSEFLISSFILSNGNIGNGNNYRNYSVSPLIPVKQGKVALYVPNGKAGTTSGQIVTTNNGYGLYAANGTTPVARVSFVEIASNIFSITIPEGAAYIRFCFYSGQNNSGELSRNKFEKAVAYFNEYWVLIESESTELTTDDFAKKSNGSIHFVKREDGSYLRVSSSEISEKKILVFGDSIWGMDRETGVPLWLQEYCGATVYNGAIGGTWVCGDRVSRGGDAKWQPFDAPYLIQATITQVWTDQDAYASQVASYIASETLPLLKTINISDIDIVILAYGTNDYSGHTIDEIKSAYAGVVSAILTANPAIRILVCCPAWRTINDVSADTYVNSNGFTMPQMNEGIIDMAKANHVDWIDMFYALPWNQLTKAVYLLNDEVHPTVDGSKVYAHVVNGKLRSMY